MSTERATFIYVGRRWSSNPTFLYLLVRNYTFSLAWQNVRIRKLVFRWPQQGLVPHLYVCRPLLTGGDIMP